MPKLPKGGSKLRTRPPGKLLYDLSFALLAPSHVPPLVLTILLALSKFVEFAQFVILCQT